LPRYDTDGHLITPPSELAARNAQALDTLDAGTASRINRKATGVVDLLVLDA
jgi:hypothetical protein